jgi:hypothetical protein
VDFRAYFMNAVWHLVLTHVPVFLFFSNKNENLFSKKLPVLYLLIAKLHFFCRIMDPDDFNSYPYPAFQLNHDPDLIFPLNPHPGTDPDS